MHLPCDSAIPGWKHVRTLIWKHRFFSLIWKSGFFSCLGCCAKFVPLKSSVNAMVLIQGIILMATEERARRCGDGKEMGGCIVRAGMMALWFVNWFTCQSSRTCPGQTFEGRMKKWLINTDQFHPRLSHPWFFHALDLPGYSWKQGSCVYLEFRSLFEVILFLIFMWWVIFALESHCMSSQLSSHTCPFLYQPSPDSSHPPPYSGMWGGGGPGWGAE